MNRSERRSLVRRLRAFSKEERDAILSQLDAQSLEKILFDWSLWAREDQLPPEDEDWIYWLILAGRGWGKTRTAAEWANAYAEENPGCILHLIGATAADVRDTMIEGESGIVNCARPDFKPVYQPSNRRVVWPNGSMGVAFAAESYEMLRGPQCHAAWIDEIEKFRYQRETWEQFLFGFRLGEKPRCVITTTPKASELLREIMKDPATRITRGSTFANAANLSKAFLDGIRAKYEGTRLGLQELHAELLLDTPGALWSRENIDRNRVRPDEVPPLRRLVVAVDPATTAHDESDETGIILAGLGEDGRGYVLGDFTCRESPEAWARKVVEIYRDQLCDAVCAETNQGGDMVEALIRIQDPNVRYRGVRATRSKHVRAEPISSLYEQNRISHVGLLSDLETQITGWAPGSSKKSPDRLDALVWAFTELFLAGRSEGAALYSC